MHRLEQLANSLVGDYEEEDFEKKTLQRNLNMLQQY
jgi:hypothetical protein